MSVQIVRDSWDFRCIANGTQGSVNRTKTKNTIKTTDVVGQISNTDGLLVNHQVGGKCDRIEPFLSKDRRMGIGDSLQYDEDWDPE